MGATAAPAQYTEHRSTRGFNEEGEAGDGAGASVISINRSGHGQPPASSTTDNQLSSGDRVVLRFLDDPKAASGLLHTHRAIGRPPQRLSVFVVAARQSVG